MPASTIQARDGVLEADGTGAGAAWTRVVILGAVVGGGRVVAVVVVTDAVVGAPKAMVSTSRVVVVTRENGVENGRTTSVVMVAGTLATIVVPTTDVSGAFGKGSSGRTTGNVGGVVVDE